MNIRCTHSFSIRRMMRWTAALLLAAPLPLTAESVNWQGPAGSRIKQIRYYPKETTQDRFAAPAEPAATAAVSNIIDSPPVDGFVPWIVVSATNRRETEDNWVAVVESSIRGSFPSGSDWQRDYMVGIFDTGASAHVIGYENAVNAGLFNSTYLTSNTTQVTGVTGSVDAWVSWPYALFMDGLDALEPNGLGQSEYILTATAGMVGQSNISTIIGRNPGSFPDLVTAIGSPMSVYFDTHIQADQMLTITHNGKSYTGPKISFYTQDDPAAPGYPNKVPLELKPLGSLNVQYIPTIDSFTIEYVPATPSIIMGNASQSLFFIHGVDLTDGGRSAIDKDRFMLDTGAQITVIGSRIAARLGLTPAAKEFEVEIEGVTGESIMAPGFYVDALTIPAMGQWLDYANVPVVLLDVFSPEGGTLDGIIGMNLFTQYNLILRGGGFMLQDDPALEFERISAGPQTGDIAPNPRDGRVDLQDMSAMSAAWLTGSATADIAPLSQPDGIVNIQDLTLLAENWLAGVSF